MAMQEWEVRQKLRNAEEWVSTRTLTKQQNDLLENAKRYMAGGQYELAEIDLRALLEAIGGRW